MNSSIRQRIEKLEQRIGINPVILTLADGSVHQLRADGRHFLKLASLLGSDAESHPLSCELSWLRDSTSITGEASEAFNLLRVLIQGPSEDPEDAEILRLLEEKKGASVGSDSRS